MLLLYLGQKNYYVVGGSILFRSDKERLLKGDKENEREEKMEVYISTVFFIFHL